jgi:hypothetical protein
MYFARVTISFHMYILCIYYGIYIPMYLGKYGCMYAHESSSLRIGKLNSTYLPTSYLVCQCKSDDRIGHQNSAKTWPKISPKIS